MTANQLVLPYVVEIVKYRLKPEADAKQFLENNRAVGKQFTSAQPGFLHREIGQADDGSWLIAVYWKTAENARNSIGNIETIPEIVATYMAAIDRDTLSRTIYEIL